MKTGTTTLCFFLALCLSMSCDVITNSCYRVTNTLTVPCRVKLIYQWGKDTIVRVEPGATKNLFDCPYNRGNENFDDGEYLQEMYSSIRVMLNDSMLSGKELREKGEWNFSRSDKNNGSYNLVIDSADFQP